MKRYVIQIIALIILVSFLTSCGQSKEVINEAKTTVVQQIIINEEIDNNSKESDFFFMRMQKKRNIFIYLLKK